jgi:hypothetical protein
MNEADLIVKGLHTGLKVAGNSIPGAEAVLVPLGFVLTAATAFSTLIDQYEETPVDTAIDLDVADDVTEKARGMLKL